MRVILAGQKSFGVAALERLLECRHDVAYVSSEPEDKLWLAAERSGVPTRRGLDYADVQDADVDLIVCAHSYSFVGRKSRAATRLGALVGHPSLLPRHRGKSAVEWTIRMRDPIAGFSWFWADDGVDTGPICHQEWLHVDPAWDHHDLWGALFPLGLDAMAEALLALNDNVMVAIPQDERVATREPAIEPSKRLYRPELPAIGVGPAGFEVIAHRGDPRLRAFEVY